MTVNVLEEQGIAFDDLPATWKDSDVLKGLKLFLQKNWEHRQILYYDSVPNSKQQFLYFGSEQPITANNYIGTIVFAGERLNIFPKMFARYKKDPNRNFNFDQLTSDLSIWLQYCTKTNFPFIVAKTDVASSDNLIELFITIYLYFVEDTLKDKPYWTYEDIVEEGQNPKGKINFQDYSARKYPSADRGEFEYSYSKFQFDNVLNQVIKSTCKLLLKLSNNPKNKRKIKDIIASLSEVTDIRAVPSDCDRIRLNRVFKNYSLIKSMSKMFLENSEFSNEIGGKESFCFLFPAEKLFEGFIGGYLKTEFGQDATVVTQSTSHYAANLYKNGVLSGPVLALQEDILYSKNGKTIVLDTKYKEIQKLAQINSSNLDINSGDFYQMVQYALTNKTDQVVLIYPLYRRELPDDTTKVVLSETVEGHTINITVIKVPFIFDEDTQRIEDLENILKTVLAD
jgi:5-methylcytosine-specific restriction enzyme subunit McrC